MGIGYNALLREKGERLDMLEYVAWMKRLLDSCVSFVSFWDASMYQIANVLPKKRFCNSASSPGVAGNFLETLAEELQQPKRVEIAENCALRNKYLWNLRSLLGLPSRSGTVRSAAEFFGPERDERRWARYATLLCEAAQYVERLREKNPKALEEFSSAFRNENPAAQMYLPMEIAEALYLQNNTPGIISGKYGPQSERPFDDCILGLQEERFQPYAAMRSPLNSPARPGYLKPIGDWPENVLWTSSSNDRIASVVKGTRTKFYEDVECEYSDFVRGYLRVLAEPDEKLVDCAIRLRDAMRIEEVK